jgi:hypothetical protein
MKKWELVIVWETGEQDIYEYETEQEAEAAGRGMRIALGNQIGWYGVRRKRG